MLFFDVLGLPKPEPRPRAGKHGIFVPSDADDWKREVRAVAVGGLRTEANPTGADPLSGVAFELGVVFRMPRPKSHFRTGRFAGLLKPSAPWWHTGRPDFDNLLKSTLDALGSWQAKPSLLWADDAQVVRLGAGSCKRYVRPGEEPGALIWIHRIEDPNEHRPT